MFVNLTASPTKLRDGSWGANVPSDNVSVGDIITVSTRSGKSWDAEITHILWIGNSKYGKHKVSICATKSIERRPAQSSGGSYEPEYCYYPCPVSGRKCCSANGPCHDCE